MHGGEWLGLTSSRTPRVTEQAQCNRFSVRPSRNARYGAIGS